MSHTLVFLTVIVLVLGINLVAAGTCGCPWNSARCEANCIGKNIGAVTGSCRGFAYAHCKCKVNGSWKSIAGVQFSACTLICFLVAICTETALAICTSIISLLHQFVGEMANTPNMIFEFLPNELLLNLFKYVPDVDILRIFLHQNRRFTDLVFLYFQTHTFDLTVLSKQEFEIVFEQHFPWLRKNITSFYLWDYIQQMGHALSNYFLHNQWIRLKSFTLQHLHMRHISDQLFSGLSSLTDLNLIDCFLEYEEAVTKIIDSIWSLSKPTHCR
ncbi:unnamed protein product [Adineta ricciae]|uniref:F-box domain-containing protein n=1 Tax=Adineta ricciae TaxID=249248 RepID=A0A815UHL7_ADIRI|nr:unnamed protein product [Adineta ricciae]